MRLSLCLFSTALATLACAQTAATAPPYFPDSEAWETITPAEAGLDAAQLERALELAEQRSSKGVIVLRGGKIVAERYWQGWDQSSTGPLNSATKSVMAVLVGMTIDDGSLKGVDQPSADLLEEWSDSPEHAGITLRHHLSMTTGLEMLGTRQEILRGSLARNERQYATDKPVTHEPGTAWAYHNPAYRLLFAIIEEATGKPCGEVLEERVFARVGMEHARLAKKRRGDDYTTIHCSTRDAARFGLLCLRGGKWNDEQLVSEAFLADATRPSQELNASYGYLFWLNAGDTYRLPEMAIDEPSRPGPLLPSCPRDTYAALGKDDQKIYVVPSLDLVVVRLGDKAQERRLFRRQRGDFAPSDFDDPFLGSICAAVLGSDSARKERRRKLENW